MSRIPREERQRRKASLAHRRKLWAYEDAKRGSQYHKRPQRKQWQDDAVIVGLVILLAVVVVFTS